MTTPRPLLSLCIPTYNRADWLRVGLLAVAPMMKQAGGLAEVVVSDNCSPDGGRTERLIREVQSLYPVRYHRQSENIGGSPNMAYLVNELAQGEHVWVLGDDDMVCNDGLTRVLAVLQNRPELNYIHVNHLVYTGAEPLGSAVSPGDISFYNEDFQDRYLPELSEIVGTEPNCFTATYGAVLRRRLAVEAFQMDAQAPPFSTVGTVVAHAVYVIENLLHEPAWYVGQPCLVASAAISWRKYRAQYGLVLMHDLYDLLETNGVDSGLIEILRRKRLRFTADLLWEMLTDPTTGHQDTFSLWEYQKRHARHPELWTTMAELVQRANQAPPAVLDKAA